MPHANRKQVRVPARLWDEMMLALDQSLAQLEITAPDPGVVTRQVHAFGQRTLAEARRRGEQGIPENLRAPLNQAIEAAWTEINEGGDEGCPPGAEGALNDLGKRGDYTTAAAEYFPVVEDCLAYARQAWRATHNPEDDMDAVAYRAIDLAWLAAIENAAKETTARE